MISAEQIFVIIFTVWAWGLSCILAVHLHTHRQRVRDETADEPPEPTMREAELRRRIEDARALLMDETSELVRASNSILGFNSRGISAEEKRELRQLLESFRERLRGILSGQYEVETATEYGPLNVRRPTESVDAVFDRLAAVLNDWHPVPDKSADEPKLNPLSGVVAELQRELDAVKQDRDTLLACRAGEQGCFVCPDANCGDNQNPKFTSDAVARIRAADRLAYAVGDALVAPCRGETSRAVEELARYVRTALGTEPGGVRDWMRKYEAEERAHHG